MEERTFLPMNCWAAEDIPSNKIIDANPANLSNVELLSIILGTGSNNETSVDLARKILVGCNNQLSVLAKKSPKQLTFMRGVGKQKAARILAAIELGKRRQSESIMDKPDLSTATRIYNYMAPILQDRDIEEFHILLINHNWKLIKSERIGQGGITEVSADIRIMIREAILSNATIMAVCHNHPSGNIRTSRIDDTLTQSIKKACDVMRIHFADHVIVTDGAYYSYREQGKL